MEQVWQQVTAWQRRFRRQLGVRFVYLTDEWYLRLGKRVPSRAAYDGLDLRENGVGLARALLDAWPRLRRTLSQFGAQQTWVTGVLAAPLLASLAADLAARTGLRADVLPVPNRFFGETVTVAGLLTGQDVVSSLLERPPKGAIVLPEAMFRGPDGQTLDEMRPEDIAAAIGREAPHRLQPLTDSGRGREQRLRTYISGGTPMSAPATSVMRDLADRYLRSCCETHPPFAVWLGFHEYDGRLPDLSRRGLETRLADLRRFLADLEEIDPADLDEPAWLDYQVVRHEATFEAFVLEDWRRLERDPIPYLETLDVSNYDPAATDAPWKFGRGRSWPTCAASPPSSPRCGRT